MGLKFTLWGWNSPHWGQSSPCGAAGGGHTPPIPAWNQDQHNQQGNLNHVESYFLFWRGFVLVLFFCLCLLLFWGLFVVFLGGNPCFPSRGRLKEVRRLWWWIFPIHDYYAVLFQASLPAVPGISPQLKDFPPKPGGCPQHGHSPEFPNLPFLQSHSQCPPQPLPVVLALWDGSRG